MNNIRWLALVPFQLDRDRDSLPAALAGRQKDLF
jgi:hypothetical protein